MFQVCFQSSVGTTEATQHLRIMWREIQATARREKSCTGPQRLSNVHQASGVPLCLNEQVDGTEEESFLKDFAVAYETPDADHYSREGKSLDVIRHSRTLGCKNAIM